jgi:hypothetical protein
MSSLRARWSKREKDILISFPSKPDGHLLQIYLNCERYSFDGTIMPSLVKELESRGYDITTLKFSIQRKTRDESQSK